MRWLNETKRLCWRSVCFLPLHTGASSDPHLVVLRMAASADISEVGVQVKHTQCLTGRAFILSRRTRYEDAGVDLLVTASV